MDEQNMQDFDGAPVHLLRMNFFNDWEQNESRIQSDLTIFRTRFKLSPAFMIGKLTLSNAGMFMTCFTSYRAWAFRLGALVDRALKDTSMSSLGKMMLLVIMARLR